MTLFDERKIVGFLIAQAASIFAMLYSLYNGYVYVAVVSALVSAGLSVVEALYIAKIELLKWMEKKRFKRRYPRLRV